MRVFNIAYEAALTSRHIPRLNRDAGGINGSKDNSNATAFTKLLEGQRKNRVHGLMTTLRVELLQDELGLSTYELSVLAGCPWDQWKNWLLAATAMDLPMGVKLWIATLENHVNQTRGRPVESLHGDAI